MGKGQVEGDRAVGDCLELVPFKLFGACWGVSPLPSLALSEEVAISARDHSLGLERAVEGATTTAGGGAAWGEWMTDVPWWWRLLLGDRTGCSSSDGGLYWVGRGWGAWGSSPPPGGSC